MKVVMVKQALDLHGPLQSFKWNNDAEGLFPIWTPFKVTYWEMTCALKADWYIVPQQLDNEYIRRTRTWFPKVAEILTKNTKNITPLEDVPWKSYDLVITFDPILNKQYPPVLAYIAEEHTLNIYKESLIRPLAPYDLFLAHAADLNTAPQTDYLATLPKSIAFPFMRDYSLVRQIFKEEKEDKLWLDHNMVRIANALPWKLGHKNVLRDAYNRFRMGMFLKKLSEHNIALYTKKPVGLDTTKIDDGKIYLDSLSRCKYYLGFEFGRNGVGQTLAEAASLGCICFGEKNVVYHDVICHPFCLLDKLESFNDKFNEVRKDPELQAEIKFRQDQALNLYFLERPLNVLKKACEIKRVYHGPDMVIVDEQGED